MDQVLVWPMTDDPGMTCQTWKSLGQRLGRLYASSNSGEAAKDTMAESFDQVD